MAQSAKLSFSASVTVSAAVLGTMLAGCTYVSEEPLISAETAVFPFAAITLTDTGNQKNLSESITLVRKDGIYVAYKDASETSHVAYRLAHVEGDYYVLEVAPLMQPSGSESPPPFSYLAVRLSLAAKEWRFFDPPLPNGALPSGLSQCSLADSARICVASLAVFESLVREAISSGSLQQYTAEEIFWVSDTVGSLDEGLRAVSRRDFAEALTVLRPLAAEGNNEAQLALGNAFYMMDPPADEKAFELFRMAAAAGNARAQNNLGVMYEKGRGIDQDHVVAAEWYRRAADQGNQQAKKNLSDLAATPVPWRDADGLELADPYRWVQIASRLDLEDAIAIANSFRGQRSRVVSSRNGWFAVVLGPYPANDIESFRNAYNGPELPDDAWLTRGQGYLEMLWPSDAVSLVEAAAAYERGDYPTALQILKPLADEGLPQAQLAVGGLYEKGEGVARDFAEAIKWYRRAAEQGNMTAQYRLGSVFENGLGVPQNYAEAAKWFRLAAAQGNLGAIERLKMVEQHLTADKPREQLGDATDQYLCNLALGAGKDTWDDRPEYATHVAQAKRRSLSIDDCRVALGMPSDQSPPAAIPVQRAILYEQPLDAAGAAVGVAAIGGTVTWSYLPNGINGPEVVANVGVPGRALKVELSVRRNSDATLPASHIVEVVVDELPGFPGIREVPRMVLKASEEARGQSLIGAWQRVAPGVFWMALSGVDADVRANQGLLAERMWIDLPLVYETGQRAILTFEKGQDGQAAFDQAFAEWARLAQGSPAETTRELSNENTGPETESPGQKLKLTAEAGDKAAQYRLGITHFVGRRYAEALPWFRLAAAQGHADAQFKLGVLYWNGWAVSSDHNQASVWFRMAAAQGHPGARDRVKELDKAVPAALPPSHVAPGAIPQKPVEFTNGGILVQVSRCRDVSPCREVGNADWVEVTGDIAEGDGRVFKQALLAVESPVVLVSLNSEGGHLLAGMEIGRAIWNLEYATVVEPDARCASACAFAWLAGRPKFVAASAEIGFHAPWREDDGTAKASTEGSAMIGGYLNSIGIPLEAIYEMNIPGPDDDLMWLTAQEAKRLRIPVEEWPE